MWTMAWERARTSPFTQALVRIAVTTFTASELPGTRKQAVEVLGVQPGRAYTLWSYLAVNIALLEIAGTLAERRLGTRTAAALALGAAALGVLAGTLIVPGHWENGSNWGASIMPECCSRQQRT